MEEKTLESLVASLPKTNGIIIIIGNDFSEGTYRIEEHSDHLEDLIRNKHGYCCIMNDTACSYWNYNSKTEMYEYFGKEVRNMDIFLHDKVHSKLDIKVIKSPTR